MSADTIFFLNFGIHSVVLGAIGWLLVRLAVRDALRRCILANLAVLFCLIGPFHIFLRDVSPLKQPVPVWTPLQETFEADWRVAVSPAIMAPPTAATPQTQGWSLDVDAIMGALRWVVWAGVVFLLGRLVVQSVRVQRWAWRLRSPARAEYEKLPAEIDPSRVGVFDHAGTPCVAGWFFPVIAVPASAFQELNHTQWRWLMRHESEHLRGHDTVAVLIQHMVRALLWWNPFVHALIEEYARAREEACDAAALGEEKAHTPYAEFLLSWAARPAPLPACVMSMAQSLPARRLKARLTALMEARGVRKKVGALFVLLCLAFATIAPLLAASFGIATATGQEPMKAGVDDGKMHTRVYLVAPDFLSGGAAAEPGAAGLGARSTARELLEEKGVPFPDGAAALFQAATAKLIVRNTLANLALIEGVIDAVHTRPVMVYFTCRLIQADQHLGKHGSILSAEDAKRLVESPVWQKKGVNHMSSPRVTTKFDQEATVEVAREVLPKLLPNGKRSGDLKLVGPSIRLTAKPPVKGKSTVDVKVDLGVDPDSDEPWISKKEPPPDWDRVQVYHTAAQGDLASGETLVLHLQGSKKAVTVLVMAEALKPDGTRAANFAETTLAAPPAREGRVMPEEAEKAPRWFTRVYRVPAGFGGGQTAMEYLKANGIAFPPGTEALLAEQKLTVRNTRENLDLVEGLVESHVAADMQNEGQIKLVVRTLDVNTDSAGLMKLMFPDMKPEPGTSTAPPDTIRSQFTVQGILTEAQLQSVLKDLRKKGHQPVTLPEAAVRSGKETVFDLPQQPGSSPLKVTPTIAAGGHTIDVMVQSAAQNTQVPRAFNTAVTLWNGQTLMLAGQPDMHAGMMRVIFLSARMFRPAGDEKR